MSEGKLGKQKRMPTLPEWRFSDRLPSVAVFESGAAAVL